MYTQCPDCLTIYKISVATLGVGRGHVRCGHCNARFDALSSLCEQLPSETVELLPRSPAQEDPPVLKVPALRPKSQQAGLYADTDLVASRQRNRPRPQPKPAAPAPTVPAFVGKRSRQYGRSGSSVGCAIGSLLLALVLAAQFGYAYREPLLADQRLRPYLEQACAQLGCSLPPVVDLDALVLLSRDVRPHPSVLGALMISASVVNRSPHPQPYPVIEITLSDLNENRIAMRRFQPHDYLSDRRRAATGIQSEAVVSLVLEVEDPGRDAVAFQFRFL